MQAKAAILFLTGELALASREAEPAIAAFEQVLALPDHDGYDVRVRLALAEIHRKNPAAAEQHLRRAIALDPTRVEPHALLVELYADEHREADKLAEMDAALALEPQSAKLAKELVLGLGRAQRPGRVADVAPIAIFIDPADPDLHAALGRALAATGKTAAAAAAFEARAALPAAPTRRVAPDARPSTPRSATGRPTPTGGTAPRATARARARAAAVRRAPSRAALSSARSGSGECQRQCRPPPCLAVDVDPPAVLDDDLLHQRQPQAGALAPWSRRTDRRSWRRSASGIPAPLSDRREAHLAPRCRLERIDGPTRRRPPLAIASRALRTRFSSA